MRLLFEIDKRDYKEGGTTCVRPSVRGIIVKEDKIAMIHSLKYDYYKFPGGGIEPGESQLDALIREVKEESGLIVKAESAVEFGQVHRVQKGRAEDIFIQDNYYYLCKAEKLGSQQLDDYEEAEQFTLEYVTPEYAINVNKTHDHFSKKGVAQFEVMIERESRVLAQLVKEGCVNK